MDNIHSEIIGSFTRNGNFPIEADYIFNSESELLAWASDPYVKPTLHEGLLKVVKTTNGQELWWVVLENGDLIFKKFSSGSATSNTLDWYEESI